jgi:hypothetical protein
MKLQFLTKHAVSNQEMETVKGGKRICIVKSPKMIAALNSAVLTIPNTTTTISSIKIQGDILIEWRSCPKKP